MKVYKFTFPFGSFKNLKSRETGLSELHLSPGQVTHCRMPSMHLLQEYVTCFHSGISLLDQCAVFKNEVRLSRDVIAANSRFIPHTRIQNGFRRKSLREIIEFWLQFQPSEADRAKSSQVVKNLLLERWFEYVWEDLPPRVQVTFLLNYLTIAGQFVTVVLPDTRWPSKEIDGLFYALRNIAQQKELSIVLMSRSRDFEDFSIQSVSFEGFKVQGLDEEGFEDEDFEQLA